MAKLTKKDRAALESVLQNAERAERYIMREDIAVCRVGKQPATTTREFTRSCDDRKLYEVERAYGSDLCGMQTAIGKLRDFLRSH